MASKSCIVLVIVALVSLSLLAAGIALTFVFPEIIKEKVKELLPLKNGSESYTNWKNPPVTVYMQFYMFDVKNAYEIINNGEKPMVEQRGPYTYRETRPKTQVKFSANGTLLSYHSPKYYTFVPELSQGSDNDTITSINLAYVGLTSLSRRLPGFLRTVINAALSITKDGLFAKHTVHQVLWGYKDPLIQTVKEIAHTFGQNLSSLDDTVGLFYKQPNGNQTDDGLYTIYTGQDKLDHFAKIASWNNKKYLPYWNTSYCNMINGSDGTLFPPFLKKSDRLYLFSTDICRSIYVTYESETEAHGIPLWRYTAPPSVFENHTANPANLGYCVPDCLGTGVLNLSGCKKGVPIVVSQPHFYQAYPGYINAIEGMHPSKAEHETFMEIEYNTGTAMKLSKKLQINMEVKPDSNFEDLKNLKHLIFPVAWLNESAEISESMARKFRSEVTSQIKMATAIQYGLIALGGFILLCLLVGLITVTIRKKGMKVLNVQVIGSREGLLAGDT